MLNTREHWQDVRGWRGKIGYMAPSVQSLSGCYELYQIIPEGVEIFIQTLGMTSDADNQAEHALSQVDDVARRLGTRGVQFIIVGGTPLVAIKGHGGDRELIKRVEELAKCPATTSLTAIIQAFSALKVRKVVHVSFILDEVNRRIKKFLEDSGLEVISIKSLNIPTSREISDLPLSTRYTVAKEAYLKAPEADGILITGPVAPQVIDCLERDLGIPVVNSNQACLWVALKAIKVIEAIKGYGRLFEK